LLVYLIRTCAEIQFSNNLKLFANLCGGTVSWTDVLLVKWQAVDSLTEWFFNEAVLTSDVIHSTFR